MIMVEKNSVAPQKIKNIKLKWLQNIKGILLHKGVSC